MLLLVYCGLLRCIVFDFEDGDEAWFSKLTQHGFSEADILSIVESVLGRQIPPTRFWRMSLRVWVAAQLPSLELRCTHLSALGKK